MAKRKHIRHGTAFWDHEYANRAGHLKLSTEAGEDLVKFTRWLVRETGKELLNPTSSALDLGCGNGRNLIFLAREFGMHGLGYDTSVAAIKEAESLSSEFNLSYTVRSIAGTLDVPDKSQTFVLDMMTSHILGRDERRVLRDEIYRVLSPGGYLFMKTFLRDGDLHTRRLLRDHAGKEEGTYVHPVIGVEEFVYSEDELVYFLSEKFVVHKTYASHKHILKGKARKRRTISVYAEKSPYEER